MDARASVKGRGRGKGDVGSKLAKVGLRGGNLWMLKWRTGALTSVLVRIL